MAEHLLEQGIEVVLVGGLAVEIYSENAYLTKDIDMVNSGHQSTAQLSKAMEGLGFCKKGRIYSNPSTDYVVEFPPAPLSVGDELISEHTRVAVGNKFIPILNVGDVVKDRLAAFIHWQDNSSLIQAVAIILKHECSPSKYQAFCEREGDTGHYRLLRDLYVEARQHPIRSMTDLEPILTALLIAQL